MVTILAVRYHVIYNNNQGILFADFFPSLVFLGSIYAGLIQRRQEEFCRLLPCGAGGFSFVVAGFCNKVSSPNFYLFVLKWPSRQSRNFGALHNQLLTAHCTINCVPVRWKHNVRQCKSTFGADNYVGQCTTWQLKLPLQT